jgi:2-keto-4-pentenoate hydratase/2-oxohepta-3-ene-1,7-dioic acid hydratase in catechol pathway
MPNQIEPLHIGYPCLLQEPIIFLKPTSSYIRQGAAIEIPPGTNTLDHEVELGVVMSKKGRDISREMALDYVAGEPACSQMLW